MMRDGVMPDQIHNYAHNNEWLIRDLATWAECTMRSTWPEHDRSAPASEVQHGRAAAAPAPATG